MSELEGYLKRFRLYFRQQTAWLALQRTFWLPALTSLIIQIAGRILPVPNLDLYTAIPWLLWLTSAPIYALFKRISLMNTAAHVDMALGLKERLSTSLAFKSFESSSSPALIRKQREDALRFASEVDPKQAFPLSWCSKPLAAGMLLLCLALASLILPNRQDQVIQERQAVQAAAQEQAQKLTELSKQIQEDQTISAEKRAELIRQLEELSAALRQNPGDLEQALADLSRLEEQLKAQIDPEISAQPAFLDALASRMSKMASTQPSGNDLQTIENAVEKLADQLEDLDQDQIDQLSRELAQLSAQASQAGNLQLSQALSSLAQSVQSGDPQSIEKSAQSMQTALTQMSQTKSDQQAVQGVLAQSQSSQQALAQAGNQAIRGSGQTAGQGQSPGGGGGTKANQLPPFRGGRTNLPSPRGDAPAAPTGLLNDQVFAPWERSATTGQQLFIPGQDTGTGETGSTESSGSQPGLSNPALTPYRQVLPLYLSAAYRAMQQASIPADLIDYVRLYFSSLDTQ